MQKTLLASAVALALISSLASAETTSSEISTHSTTTTVAPANPVYSSTRTQEQVDEHGNVIKKSQTYNSKDPVTGESRSSSSTSVESPDGTKSTVEQERTTDGSNGGSSAVEKRTTVTTSH